MYILLPQPFDWTPGAIRSFFHEVGVEVEVEPEVKHNNPAVPSLTSTNWDWCQITWAGAPEYADYLELARGETLPKRALTVLADAGVDAPAGETLQLNAWSWWDHQEFERWADLFAVAATQQDSTAVAKKSSSRIPSFSCSSCQSCPKPRPFPPFSAACSPAQPASSCCLQPFRSCLEHHAYAAGDRSRASAIAKR